MVDVNVWTLSFEDFVRATWRESEGKINYVYDDYFEDGRLEFEDWINREVKAFYKGGDFELISMSYTVSFINKNILYHLSCIGKKLE